MTYAYIEFSAPIHDYGELDSWSLSNLYPVPALGGSSGGSRAQSNDLSFVTADGYLTKKLFEAVSHGNTYKKVGLFLYTNAGDLYLLFKFADGMVTNVQTSGGSSKVSASLNFASYTYEYFET